MKKAIWIIWLMLTLGIASYYLYTILVADNKQDLLIGDTTHGHFQIEMSCDTCHTSAFGGPEVIQEACVNCHQDELKTARDSHPKKKFTDPRNASTIEILDARLCISCHTEHQKEQTRAMGVTLPDDYCFHCHQEVGKERASHQDLAFDSCASAGCHNYHDNRALYEDFLVEHANMPWLKELAVMPTANNAKQNAQASLPHHNLSFEQMAKAHPNIMESWQHTSHADAGINCGACHSDASGQWNAKPGIEQCSSCHKEETDTFLKGKHGLRLAQDMTALNPADSELNFHPTASAHDGCNSCHQPHQSDPQFAAQDACLTCHSDPHSLAFKDSPHGKLAEKAQSGDIPAESVVTCATCHMPNEVINKNGTELVITNHNQNDNLRPNEKMIRPVCMQCHSLEFSIDALADKELIGNNFSHPPTDHVPSVDWALKRAK